MAAQRIKVMSYNVHFGCDLDNRYDLDAIAEEIRAADADIVGLQEVDVHWGARSQWESMVDELASRLSLHAFFAPIYELPGERSGQSVRQFGVALLSRYPFLRTVNRPMTRLSSQSREAIPEPMPGFAEAVIPIGDARLTVYVVHLDYRAEPMIREQQIREIRGALKESSMESNEAFREVILLGDCNARPDAPEMAPLLEVLRDTWADVSGDPGYTFPTDRPDRKIDYILATPGVKTLQADILDVKGSDHRPIVAVMELEA